MATAAELERDRKALNTLVANAKGALGRLLADVPDADAIASMSAAEVTSLYNEIRDRWWTVAGQYGSMAAALGQMQASAMMQDVGLPAPKLSDPVGIPDGAAAFSKFIDAMSQDDWQGRIVDALDGTIKTANTDAIVDIVNGSGAELIWHPTGAKTCRYCLQRASHGAYSNFRSEAQALGFAKAPHDGCDCRPQVIPPDGTYPDDYHPATYAQQVQAIDRDKAENASARRAMGYKKPGPKTDADRKREASAQAWADRQRIARERDAAKNRLERAKAAGDIEAANAARDVLARTKTERDRLNGV